MAKTPTPLPACRHAWIAGDYPALSSLAGQLYGYVEPVTTVKTTLDGKVDAVVHDAGWYGDAANSFKAAWSKDSLAAEVLYTVIEQAGDTVDDLAVALATYESTLEAQAATATAQGVTIGPDGASRPMMGPFTPEEQAAANKAAAAGNTYENVRTYLLAQAHLARQDAAQSLDGLTGQIVPESGEGLSGGDDVVVADFVRGLYAIPSAYRKAAQDALSAAQDRLKDAKAQWRASRDATPPGQAMPDDVKQALRDARGDLADVTSRLDAAANAESKLPGSKLLDYRMSDALDLLRPGASDALESASRGVRFLADIPVIDGLAVVAGTYFGTESDMEKGEGFWPAVAENGAANVAAVGAGALAGTAVAGAIAGTAIAGAPVLAVVGGAVVGGAVAVGVGEFATNLVHEDWSTDISQHGVVGGIADGIGNSAVNTGKDLADLGESIWHGIGL